MSASGSYNLTVTAFRDLILGITAVQEFLGYDEENPLPDPLDADATIPIFSTFANTPPPYLVIDMGEFSANAAGYGGPAGYASTIRLAIAAPHDDTNPHQSRADFYNAIGTLADAIMDATLTSAGIPYINAFRVAVRPAILGDQSEESENPNPDANEHLPPYWYAVIEFNQSLPE